MWSGDWPLFNIKTMRPIERIDRFLKGGAIDKLHDQGLLGDWEFTQVCQAYNEIKAYWDKYPDQRFYQVLINLQVIEDVPGRWGMDDIELLQKIDVYTADLLRWKSYYNKAEERLSTPITRKISELDTDHINAIYKYADKHGTSLPSIYDVAFTQELEKRINDEAIDENVESSQQENTKCHT